MTSFVTQEQPFVYVPVSNPFNPLKPGVSSNTSIISLLETLGGFGGGPPPVFLDSLLNSENSFFTVLWRFFHLSFTSDTVQFAVPTVLFVGDIVCLFFNIFSNHANFVNGKTGFSFLFFASELISSRPATLAAITFSCLHVLLYMFFPKRSREAANNWFYRRIANRRLNLFSGKTFYPQISYPGNKKFNRGIAANLGLF